MNTNNNIKNLHGNLTKKEIDIMTVLWSVGQPLSTSEICKHAEDINIKLNLSTVQMTIIKLLEEGYIKVGNITKIKKVLARAFEPTITPDEYALLKIQKVLLNTKKSRVPKLIATLLESADLAQGDLEELASVIEELKTK